MLLYSLILLFMEGVFSETVSVKEGGSVTLFPQLAEIKKDDVIDWRFGDDLIARVRNNNPSVYEDVLGGKFRDRLKLDGQTGDLTITNIRKDDAGVYELFNSINTIKKTFSVSVSGVFSETVSVKEGESVTLSPRLPDIKKDDVIDWRFGNDLIARVRSNNNPSVYEDVLGGKFRDRLKLDGRTGDLTITNFRKDDAGVYELSNSIDTIKKTFSVRVVFSETLSVKEGESVTLYPRLTEINKDDVIDWRFGDNLIGSVKNINVASVYEELLDGKFRGRLKLDGQSGNLTITNITKTDAGDYEVSNRFNTFQKTFNVSVSDVQSLVSSDLSGGVIAGIVAGVLAVVGAVVLGAIGYKKKSEVL